jgi:hypothetical protein
MSADMEETEIDEEIDLEPTSCARCGMEKQDWRGNQGRGYPNEGDVYCCKGCAEDTGCTCEGVPEKETAKKTARRRN